MGDSTSGYMYVRTVGTYLLRIRERVYVITSITWSAEWREVERWLTEVGYF